MSFSTPGTCPHDRDVFVWVADGPWLGDPADPDYGHFPWVHNTSTSPGHLEVCDLKPFATLEEAGEVCECGCETRRHEIPTGPIPCGAPRPWPCLDCGCPNFRHRPEDIAARRTRAAAQAPGPVPAAPQVPVPEPVLGPRGPVNEQLGLFGDAA